MLLHRARARACVRACVRVCVCVCVCVCARARVPVRAGGVGAYVSDCRGGGGGGLLSVCISGGSLFIFAVVSPQPSSRPQQGF